MISDVRYSVTFATRSRCRSRHRDTMDAQPFVAAPTTARTVQPAPLAPPKSDKRRALLSSGSRQLLFFGAGCASEGHAAGTCVP
jgi:hypothetical protein